MNDFANIWFIYSHPKSYCSHHYLQKINRIKIRHKVNIFKEVIFKDNWIIIIITFSGFQRNKNNNNNLIS